MSARRLAIDWTRCDGHGTCAALEPDLVGRDDWGYPILDEAGISGARASRLRRLASVCPAMALRLEVSGGPAEPAVAGR